jgi:phage tail sheath protein FI
MPEYSYPGVFVEEINVRTREIEGVPTETAAFVGFTAGGPLDEPVEIGSVLDYETSFGKVSAANPLSSAVADFFGNGGRKAFVVRTAAGPRSRRGSAELIGDEKKQTGLHALDRTKLHASLLVLPDAAYLSESDSADTINRAASFAHARRIFLIADIPDAVANKGHNEAVLWASGGVARNRNMAIYFPWLVTGSGRTKRLRPPAATTAGIYAQTDQLRGVWKAPAGQEAAVKGVTDLAHKVSAADTEKLQGASINSIRKFEGKGIVLWGARTFAPEGDNEWKYVNVRRLFLFLERSIEEGLAWAVFEPNGEALWAQVRLEISAFLHTAWRAGALQGVKAEEAYFVRCDATTMTQNDIENGRLICMIGVAPVRPAEFVIIRIERMAAKPA